MEREIAFEGLADLLVEAPVGVEPGDLIFVLIRKQLVVGARDAVA